ncbi:hypothetical protein MMUR_39170 [Mycolicibacterium murale]|uniref:Uncharacterized protein n=1 Tax=Mycolicibacterium murale TaxID=182220 RepID=A0A7I9WPY1_9MYCO|nr:hypothetical protein MMUR_39170 [Mycolicibacterium murale]
MVQMREAADDEHHGHRQPHTQRSAEGGAAEIGPQGTTPGPRRKSVLQCGGATADVVKRDHR